VEMTSNLFRTKSNGASESTMSLEKLVCQLSTFSTSDPRDTINCLRNLSKELNAVKTRSSSSPARTHRQPPEPNYKQDLFEVYRDFVEWVVEESKSLDIICRHWALKEKEKLDIGPTAAPRLVTLPSWILTAEDGSYGAGEAVFRGRKAGDSLVGGVQRFWAQYSDRSIRGRRCSRVVTKSQVRSTALPLPTRRFVDSIWLSYRESELELTSDTIRPYSATRAGKAGVDLQRCVGK